MSFHLFFFFFIFTLKVSFISDILEMGKKKKIQPSIIQIAHYMNPEIYFYTAVGLMDDKHQRKNSTNCLL